MRKTIIICLVFCIAMSIAAVSASALANSGGGTWQYQKEITIHENSGKLLTDYQVLVELSSSDFPTEAQPDGGDIRFTDADGRELSYWIEEYDYFGKYAKIWVKIPRIPASGETKITMYYNNPSASSTSDGDATFEFFDDFETINLNKWISVPSGAAIIFDNDNYVLRLYECGVYTEAGWDNYRVDLKYKIIHEGTYDGARFGVQIRKSEKGCYDYILEDWRKKSSGTPENLCPHQLNKFFFRLL
jgi:hypothetical protein